MDKAALLARVAQILSTTVKPAIRSTSRLKPFLSALFLASALLSPSAPNARNFLAMGYSSPVIVFAGDGGYNSAASSGGTASLALSFPAGIVTGEAVVAIV
jgi:hypothetical protein